MTVKEFCRKYNLKYQTVYRKIATHKNNELAGHIIKEKGESLALDDYAVDFLTPFIENNPHSNKTWIAQKRRWMDSVS